MAPKQTSERVTRIVNPETEPFTVSKGVLRANTDMYWELLGDFETACKKLLESSKNKLEVDLTEANFVSSSFVGCLGDMILQATRLRKKVTLKVTLDVSWLFEIMGGPNTLDIEVV